MRASLLLIGVLAATCTLAQEEEAKPAAPVSGYGLYQDDDLTLHADFKAGAAYINLQSANFGTGVLSRSNGRPIYNPQWAEAYAKPILAFEAGNFYGGTSLVWAGTVGSGDATNVPT